MKCLDNIYTKQIKYNAPVLYQLESLKKEYETIKQSFKYKKGVLDGLDLNKVRKN